MEMETPPQYIHCRYPQLYPLSVSVHGLTTTILYETCVYAVRVARERYPKTLKRDVLVQADDRIVTQGAVPLGSPKKTIAPRSFVYKFSRLDNFI